MAQEPGSLDAAHSAPAGWGAARRLDLVVAAVLAGVVFGWNASIARVFDRHKVFSQYDVLFNADPITRLDSIANGRGEASDKIVHPGIRLYFSRPIRLAGKVARATGLIPDRSRDEYALRRSLAVRVAPAVSGLTMAAVYWLFLGAGLSRPRSLVMTMVCCASLSQLVFGSVPDHMPVTGLAVTVLLLLAVDLAASGGRVRWWAWVLAGGVYAGATITNAAPFVLLFTTALGLSGRPLRRVPVDVALVTFGMLAVTGVTVLIGMRVARDASLSSERIANHARNYLHNNFHKAPAALLETLAPAALVTFDLPEPIRRSNAASAGTVTPGITTAPEQPTALVALVAALTLGGAFACLRSGTPMRALGAAALGVLAFNLTLHSIWGDAFILYSQHWLVPLVVLLAGNLTWPGRAGKAFAVSFAVAGLVMVVHNASLVNGIIATVSGSPG